MSMGIDKMTLDWTFYLDLFKAHTHNTYLMTYSNSLPYDIL